MDKPQVSLSPGRLLRTAEVAAYLGVTRKTVLSWSQKGLLPPPVRFGLRSLRWPRAALEAVLARLARRARSSRRRARP